MPLTLASLVTLVLAALGALAMRVARGVLEPAPYLLQSEFEVVDYDAERGVVRLPLPPPTPRQFARTDVVGRYGLLWAADPGHPEGAIAHGLLGPVTARATDWLERPLQVVVGPPPRAGAPGRIDIVLHRRDPLQDLGVAYEELALRGPAGSVAAWWIDRGSRDAVVLVHGRRRGRRIDALRALPAALAGGRSALVTSYRNHDVSDSSPSGLFTYGQDEADDLLAALAELRGRGVERVALVTISMGSAVAMVARRRWPRHGPELVGVVMDAPLVDPRTVVRARARRAGIPLSGVATDLGMQVAAWRAGVDWSALDLRALAPSLELPVLLIGAVEDSTVPIALVDEFAALLPPDRSTYWRVEGAEHVEAYNVAPEEYARRLESFLDEAFALAERA